MAFLVHLILVSWRVSSALTVTTTSIRHFVRQPTKPKDSRHTLSTVLYSLASIRRKNFRHVGPATATKSFSHRSNRPRSPQPTLVADGDESFYVSVLSKASSLSTMVPAIKPPNISRIVVKPAPSFLLDVASIRSTTTSDGEIKPRPCFASDCRHGI